MAGRQPQGQVAAGGSAGRGRRSAASAGGDQGMALPGSRTRPDEVPGGAGGVPLLQAALGRGGRAPPVGAGHDPESIRKVPKGAAGPGGPCCGTVMFGAAGVRCRRLRAVLNAAAVADRDGNVARAGRRS